MESRGRGNTCASSSGLAPLIRFLQQALTEVRLEMMTLPAEEEVSVQAVTGRPGNLAFAGIWVVIALSSSTIWMYPSISRLLAQQLYPSELTSEAPSP